MVPKPRGAGLSKPPCKQLISKIRLRGVCKFPDERDWLWGKQGLALVGRVILSKPLIQFADEWACAPSLLVVRLEATHSWKGKPVLESTGSTAELKRTSQRTSANTDLPGLLLLPVTLSAATTTNPLLRRSPSHAHGQVWLSLLWGHSSFPLAPGMHKVLYVPSNSLCFPKSRGSSVIKSHCPSKSDSLQSPSPFARSSG